MLFFFFALCRIRIFWKMLKKFKTIIEYSKPEEMWETGKNQERSEKLVTGGAGESLGHGKRKERNVWCGDARWLAHTCMCEEPHRGMDIFSEYGISRPTYTHEETEYHVGTTVHPIRAGGNHERDKEEPRDLTCASERHRAISNESLTGAKTFFEP